MRSKILGIVLISLMAWLIFAETNLKRQLATHSQPAMLTVLSSATPTLQMRSRRDSVLPREKSFDGEWWEVAAPEEQTGFINGYYDCFQYDARRPVTGGSDVEFQKAVSDFYQTHKDQMSTSVPALLRQLAVTLQSSLARFPNAEEWREPHGYYDGLWWKQSEPKEQIGYLEGYVSCYSNDVRSPHAQFSKHPEEYQELITQYYGHPENSEDTKIALVLYRFRDKSSAP